MNIPFKPPIILEFVAFENLKIDDFVRLYYHKVKKINNQKETPIGVVVPFFNPLTINKGDKVRIAVSGTCYPT